MRIPSVAERSDVGINMTPLIDVVFQLLIFFLVSSHLARQEALMPLPLPDAQTGLETELESESPRLTLNVLRDGSLVLSGRRMTRAELPDHLARWLATVGRDGELRIRGDRSVKYEHVEPLLATCARVGLPRVTFAVHEAREQRPRTTGAK